MITAVTGKPAQSPNQLRCKLDTTGVDLETPLENFTLTADHVEKATGGLSV